MPSLASLALAYIVIFATLTIACCHPLDLTPTTNVITPSPTFSYLPSRAEPMLPNSGTLKVFARIPQGTSSDGSGAVGSPAYIIWTSFCLVVGVPLAVAGLRGWRLTIGLALGCAGAGCGMFHIFSYITVVLTAFRTAAWAAVNNAVNENDLPDLIIVAIVFGFFFLGLLLGLFEFARQGGLLVLAITGGLAFGLRVVLFRDGLLIPIYWINWLVVAAFGFIPPIGFILFNRLVIVRVNVVECSGYRLKFPRS